MSRPKSAERHSASGHDGEQPLVLEGRSVLPHRQPQLPTKAEAALWDFGGISSKSRLRPREQAEASWRRGLGQRLVSALVFGWFVMAGIAACAVSHTGRKGCSEFRVLTGHASCPALTDDQTVCPEFRSLSCVGDTVCDLDKNRGCRVCACASTEPQPTAADRPDNPNLPGT